MLNFPRRHPDAPLAGHFAAAPLSGRHARSSRAVRRAGTDAPPPLSVQTRRYLARLWWVARDGGSHYRREIVWIVIANILGVSTAAMSLGGILLYAQHAKGNAPVPIHLGWIRFHVQSDLQSLILFGGVMALLGIFSGLCMYFTEWQIQRVTRRYQRLCAQRVLDLVTDPLCRGWHDLPERGTWQSVKPLVHIRARFTAFTFQSMLRCILPLFTLLGALAFLVRVDVWLTLMLVPIAGLYLMPLYRINRQVSRNQSLYRQLLPQAQAGISRHLRSQLNSSQSAARKLQLREPGILDDTYDGMMAAYFGRMIADKRVVLLNTVFFVVCLLVLFVFFGVAASRSGRSWGELVSYLVALRFAISSLRQVSGLVLKFSRFFPEYRAYSTFVDGALAIRERRARHDATDEAAPVQLTFRIGKGDWNSASRLHVPGRGVLWVLTPDRPDHFMLEATVVRLETRLTEPTNLAGLATIYADATMHPELSLIENSLGAGATEKDEARLQGVLDRLGVWHEFVNLPDGLRTHLADHPELRLSADACVALHAAPGLCDRPRTLVLSGPTVENLSAAFVDRLIAGHAPLGLTIVVDHRTPAPSGSSFPMPDTAVHGVIVMEGPAIVAGGDMAWFRQYEAEIASFLRAARVSSLDGSSLDPDEDEDEDDDDFL